MIYPKPPVGRALAGAGCRAGAEHWIEASVREMKRHIAYGLSLLCLVLALGACGDTTEEPAAGDEANNTANNTANNAGNNAVNNTPEPCTDGPECVGSAYPQWELSDFQPASERFEQVYGPAAFEAKVTVVALLAGWCPFCQRQAMMLEQLDQELDGEGVDVNFVVVNAINADTDEYRENLLYVRGEDGELTVDENGELVERCTAPMFQDVEAVDAWGMHNGQKDDIIVYGADGTVKQYFGKDDGVLSLSTAEGYAELKQAVLDAMP